LQFFVANYSRAERPRKSLNRQGEVAYVKVRGLYAAAIPQKIAEKPSPEILRRPPLAPLAFGTRPSTPRLDARASLE
jgi:hypothetical protein